MWMASATRLMMAWNVGRVNGMAPSGCRRFCDVVEDSIGQVGLLAGVDESPRCRPG